MVRGMFAAAVIAAAILPAGAAAAGTLSEDDVPGLKKAGGGKSVALGALGVRPPRSLRKAPAQGVAFTGTERRLEVGVFTLGSERAAKQALRAVGRGGKDLDLGDGAFAFRTSPATRALQRA